MLLTGAEAKIEFLGVTLIEFHVELSDDPLKEIVYAARGVYSGFEIVN
jgi:hypothetical protein